jgi:tRNA A-37 threonylcarbamoyl transferase component Bud32
MVLVHGTQLKVFDSRWPAVADRLGLGDYPSLMNFNAVPLSDTSTTRVYHLNPDAGLWPGGVYLKKFIYKSPVRFFLRPAKPFIELRNYEFLRSLNLNVPHVIAAGQRRKFGSVVDAFLLTEGIPNARPLEDIAQKTHLLLTPPEILQLLDQLAETVGIMHQARFFHIDLQWRNVLIQTEKEAGGGKVIVKVFLIDCPRGGRRWFFPRSWNGRMHDLAGLEKLASLYLSPKERLKWFKQYAGIKKIGWQDRFLIKGIIRELESRRHD